MNTENKKPSLLATVGRLAERMLVSRSTRDLVHLNTITDRLLQDTESGNIPGVKMRFNEFADAQMLSTEGDTSRLYACKLCHVLLGYMESP